jgi:aspartate aminotransferase/aminotransferase
LARDPFQLADRIHLLQPSGIRKFFELGLSMKNPIDLSIGQPDFDVPDPVKAAAIDAISAGRNRYTVTQGIEPLRKALKERYSRRFAGVENDDIIVSAGVGGGLLLAFFALFNPGDEVLVPDPYFVMYRHLASLVGARAVFVDTYPDFKITAARLAPHITPKTRAIIVNSPSNPTGATLDEAGARELAALAEKHSLTIISDEIYEEFLYEGRHVSCREFTRNCLVLSGASKSMGMPGWRMGWMLGPREFIERCYIVQQFTFVCAPSLAQHAVLAGLGLDFSAHLNDYRRKREILCGGISGRYELVWPRGAFYAFPRLPGGARPEEFIKACISRELLIVPGGACSTRDTHLRISFAAPDEKLRAAVRILNELA